MSVPVAEHYDRLSPLYDMGLRLAYPWMMARLQGDAVRALALRQGDTVLDLGCGTGLLLGALAEAVGPGGRVIGVDFSGGMLSVAGQRVRRGGWKNVELVHADVTEYVRAKPADAAIFCLSLSLIPAYGEALRHSVSLVKRGGRVVVADSWQNREKWYHPMSNAVIRFKGRFVCSDPGNRIPDILPEVLEGVWVEERMMGLYSIAAGTAPL